MKTIYRNEYPTNLPANTYVALDTEWYRMDGNKLHRPTTGAFGCMTLCADPDEVYLIEGENTAFFALEAIQDCVWVIHNAKFDITQLRRIAQIAARAKLIDTMLIEKLLWNGYYEGFALDDLSRRYLGIHLDKSVREQWKIATQMTAEMLDYSAKDASTLLRVWREQKKHITKQVMEVYQKIDLPALWAILDFRGGALDVEGWKSLAEDNKFHAKRLEEMLDFNPRSTQQAVAKLRERGFRGLPDNKAETLEKFIQKYPETEAAKQAEIVLECKEYSTFASRYGTRWLEDYLEPFPDGAQGFIADYLVTGAETGRMAARNPPLHQVPSRGTKIFREKFIARPGCKLIISDYSQQEVVIAAYVTQDKLLMEICNSGQDIYVMMAKIMYGKTIDKKDPLRKRMKAVVLGIDYGMTEFGLSKKEGISEKEAAEVISLFRQKFPGVARYMDKMRREKRRVQTVAGRTYWLNPYSSQCYRNALNAPIQGTAADITKRAVALLHQNWKFPIPFGIVNVIHDEVVLDVPEAYAEEVRAYTQHWMVQAAQEICPGMTFRADAVVGNTWADKE